MSVTQANTRTQTFVVRFVEELEYLSLQGRGAATGDQIIRSAFDIMRVDLQVSQDDVPAAFKELPFEIHNLLKHAYDNRRFVFQPLSRHIATARQLAGVA